MAMKNSRDLAPPENVRPQVIAGDLVSGDMLNGRPPLGVKQDRVCQPVGNGLLADGRPVEEFRDALGQGDLASGDVDSPLKGSNVRLFHARHPTKILVDVNKKSGSPDNKKPCTVYDMQLARKRKAEAAAPAKKKRAGTRRRRVPEVGPDGRTMGQRLRMLMLEHDPPFIPEKGGQTMLARECQKVYANGRDHAPATIKPQHIQQMLASQDSSRYLSVVAKVFGVNCLWLQFGIGEKYEKKH